MRMRVVYPAFWQSPKLANLADDWEAKFVLAGLWSYVEDNGVGLDNAGLIAAKLFPFDDPATVVPRTAAAVDTLCEKGHALRYEADVEGVRLKLIEVTDWGAWQKPDKPTPSPFPPSTSANALASDSRAAREPFAANSRQELGVRSLELGGANHSREPREQFASPPQGTPPPRRCPKHINDPHPPKCGDCKEWRELAENYDTELAFNNGRETTDRKAAIAACPLCDEKGQLLGDDGLVLDRVIKCDHKPLAAQVDDEVIP